jgi:hypothetical protein
MANIFSNLPAPAGDGAGAGVDVSTMGKERTITVQDTFRGTVNIQFSNESIVGPWVTATTFPAAGKKTISIAAQFMRVMRSGVPTVDPGLPNVDVASNDNGALFVDLPATAGDGTGAAIDVSALGTFNTISCLGTFRGTVVIEISEDGTDWAGCMTFQQPDWQSKDFVAQFMRVTRKDVPTGVAPGLPNIDVGAINDATPGGLTASASNCLIFRPGSGLTGPTIFAVWADLITRLTALRAANNAGGCYNIVFDDSVTSPAVVPAGAYDMTGVEWHAADGRTTSVDIADGATFAGLRTFRGTLIVEGQSLTTPAVTDVLNNEIVTIDGATLDVVVGGAPLYRFSSLGGGGDLAVLAFSNAGTAALNTAEPVFDVPVAGSILFSDSQTGGPQRTAIEGVVGAILFQQVRTTGAILGPQSAFLGTNLLFVAAPGPLRNILSTRAAPLVASTTLAANDVAYYDVSGGAVAQTLPLSVDPSFRTEGRPVTMFETSGTAGLTAVPAGAETINGVAAALAIPPGLGLRFISDGAGDWTVEALGASSVSAGAADRYSPPEKWTQQNVAASQAAVDLDALVSTSFDTIKAIRAGSIVGLSTRFTAAITDATASSAVVTVTINGAAGTLTIPHSSGVDPTGGEVVQAAGVDPFVAGDLLGVEITTLATFAPTTTDLEAWIDVEIA